MRLKPDQLRSALAKGDPAPVYFISGDEPLQLSECCDLLRRQLRDQGFEERLVLDVDSGFDWSSLGASVANLSLFSSRRLIELRLGQAKPGRKGASALRAYCDNLSANDVLLISAAKLDKQAQQTQWFKALDKVGVIIQVWPLEPVQLPAWIVRRLAAREVRISTDAAALIAERVEGNLLAAAQELEILQLLLDSNEIEVQHVIAAVADSSRFDVFQLVDTALAGDQQRTLRILTSLRHEGMEPILVNWALSRELRTLAHMARRLDSGQPLAEVLKEYRVWRQRVAMVKQALTRHSSAGLRRLLLLAGKIEQIVKGATIGNAWDELAWLSLRLARATRR